MFVGSIEHGHRVFGDQLIDLIASQKGLASMPYDHLSGWQDGSVTLVQQVRFITDKDSLTTDVDHAGHSGVYVAGWIRLYNRGTLEHAIGQSIEHCSDADVVWHAYMKWGSALVDHLVGDFSFVLYDSHKSKLIAVRDHLGVRPLYFCKLENGILFASSMAILVNLKGLKLTGNPEWIARYLACCSADSSLTAYSEITKVMPGHYAVFDSEGLAFSQYFNLNNVSQSPTISDRACLDEYSTLLNESIRARAGSAYPLAAENSGGFDSGTVIHLTANNLDAPERDLHCFGFSSNAVETGRACQIASDAGVATNQFFDFKNLYTASQRIQEGDRFISHAGAPFSHSMAVSHASILSAARGSGSRTLLSGFGGDEFVTNFASEALDEMLVNGDISLWLSRSSGGWLRKRLRLFKRWLATKYDYKSDAQQYFEAAVEARWQSSILKAEVVDKFEVKKQFIKKNSIGKPNLAFNELLLSSHWNSAKVSRLEDCSLAAASYGLEYRWPLLDVRLVRFYLSLPLSQKLGPNMGTRYLHRRVMAGLLPEGIEDKGFDGEPFNKKALDAFDYSSLKDPGNLSARLREFIDLSLLEKALETNAINPLASGNRAWLTRVLMLDRWLKSVE